MRRALQRLLVLAALPALAGAAAASDWWVDPVNGDDASSGVSAAEAWRTVTHATAAAAGGDLVHLLPGVYSAANGEAWPLPIRNVRYVGEAGSAHTILDGGWFTAGVISPWYELVLSGVTLQGGEVGIHVFEWHEYSTRLELHDVRILDMASHGIHADGYGGFYDDGWFRAELDRVLVAGCGGRGAWMGASSGVAEADGRLEAVDCVFRDNAGWGLSFGVGTNYLGYGTVDMDRCALIGNGQGGAWFSGSEPYSGTTASLDDCLIAGNLGDGVVADDGSSLERCTVVDNLGVGVVSGFVTGVWSSIVVGNAAPVDTSAGVVNAEYTCTDVTPPLPGVGNFVADPLFRDRAAGDYRLCWSSRCVDRARPGVPPDVRDLDGRLRLVDGDLDTVERCDLGAYELHTLELSGAPVIGGVLDLEAWGPLGGAARVFIAQAPLIDPPLPTPFGELDLDRTLTLPLFNMPTAPGPPYSVPVAIPNDPALVGQSWSFQALAGLGGPAPPWALTNAVSVVLSP